MERDQIIHDLTMLLLSKNTTEKSDPTVYFELYKKTSNEFNNLFDGVVSEEDFQKFVSRFNR